MPKHGLAPPDDGWASAVAEWDIGVAELARAEVGPGRIVALYCRSSTLYHIH
jgi:hypothetical protein